MPIDTKTKTYKRPATKLQPAHDNAIVLWYFTCDDCGTVSGGWIDEKWAKWARTHHSDRCGDIAFDSDVSLRRKLRRASSSKKQTRRRSDKA